MQGASTAVGFPFYRGGSFPNMLKHRLSQTFPHKNIEVINTAITAVNSYTLLDFTDEIIIQKPDVVIIYAGHNEYYGALGVGSTSTIGSHPMLVRMYLWAKDLRFFQLLENTYSSVLKTNSKSQHTDVTLMERMVKHQRIPFNSKMYHAGISQFENNLEKILYKYKKNNIPVILSTLVSNEKDIKPFISESIVDTTLFFKDLKQNRPAAISLADSNAMAAFLLGQHYYLQKNDSASQYLHHAKELDLLRFRAPQSINNAIIKLAEKYQCHVVNMPEIFRNYTGQTVIGNELLTEHVHPNVEGNFVMADAFYHKIRDTKLINHWQGYISFDEARTDISITAIDSIKGKLVIDNLKKSWPFDLSKSGVHYRSRFFENRKPTYEQLRALDIFEGESSRADIMPQAYKWYQKNRNYEQCLRIVQSDIIDYPELTRFYLLAGNICLKMNDLKKAGYYFITYNRQEKSSKSAQQLAKYYITCGNHAMARQTLQQAQKDGINDAAINTMLDHIMP